MSLNSIEIYALTFHYDIEGDSASLNPTNKIYLQDLTLHTDLKSNQTATWLYFPILFECTLALPK